LSGRHKAEGYVLQQKESLKNRQRTSKEEKRQKRRGENQDGKKKLNKKKEMAFCSFQTAVANVTKLIAVA